MTRLKLSPKEDPIGKEKPQRTDFPEGSWRIGTDGGYLIFRPSGEVFIGQSGKSLLAEKKSLVKGFKVLDSLGNEKPIVQDLGLLAGNIQSPETRVIQHIGDILRSSDDLAAERQIDQFASAMKATRKLLVSNRKMSNEHQRFVGAVQHLATKHRREPTKGEIADFMALNQDEVSKLSKANGFDWLPTNPPGRPKS